MDIAQLLKIARTNIGYSFSNLASLTGISAATLSSYEEGKTEPDIPNLVRLAPVLDIPFDEIDIIERTINVNKDDIYYTKTYSKGHVEYYYGKCKCGNELFILKDDVFNPLRTKCKQCTAKKFNKTFNLELDDLDVERLNTMFQNNIVKRSIKLDVPCTISLQEYLTMISGDCHYCGCKPNQVAIVNGKRFIHNGIDRIDSTRGYTQDNIVPCCTKCNMAKGSLTKDEFLQLVNDIFYNQKG